MSTRCNIHFSQQGQVCANIYRHSDGYPDGEWGVLAALEQFFTAVELATTDTRFGDPEYLAAKFVVWQAHLNAGEGSPLDFLSVGITLTDAGDGAYIYDVDCSGTERPRVTYREASYA